MILLFDDAKACEKFSARFWSKVDRQAGPEACWPWTGAAKNRHGYGGFSVNLCGNEWTAVYAHRVAAVLGNGPMPRGAHVLHSCDNPPCCNPAHLDYGTPKENCRQMHARGRDNKPRGERANTAVLAADGVRAIWDEVDSGARLRATARRHGVSFGTVKAIAHGRSWRHLGLGRARIAWRRRVPSGGGAVSRLVSVPAEDGQ